MGESSLKVFYLVSCRRLTKTPNFSKCLTLERLVVKDCDRLVEIDPSITMLQFLKHMEIKGCIGLRVLKGAPTMLNRGMVHQPCLDSFGNLKRLSTLRMENLELLELADSIGEIPGLQVLSLCDSSMEKLPESIGKLKSLVKLNISSTNIIELPDSIGELKRLKILGMRNCKLRKLPKAIGMLEKLESLDASFCMFLEGEIPMEIGALSVLQELLLDGTRISEVPPTISQLCQLMRLGLRDCEELQQLPELPTSLAHLDIKSTSLQRIPDLSNLSNLNFLQLSDYGRRRYVNIPHAPLNACQDQDLQCIGRLTRLSWLALDLSDGTMLPADFGTLTKLKMLELPGSTIKSLERIPPEVETLTCYDFESTDGWSNLHTFKYLSSLKIVRSCLTEIPLDELGQLENLHYLDVLECQFLERLPHLSSLRKLQALTLYECPRLLEIQGVEQLKTLEKLYICYCLSLKELPNLSNLQKLSKLHLLGCESLESLPIVANEETCHVNVSRCKMLPYDSGPTFEWACLEAPLCGETSGFNWETEVSS